jgi:hypothetical protein
VRLLPGFLTSAAFEEELAKCDVVLLPYEESVYAVRGSAMLYRCAELGIPAIGPANTGFGSEIAEFELGLTYSSPEEVPGLLCQISTRDWGRSGSDFLQFRREVWRSAVRFDDHASSITGNSPRPPEGEL